MAKKYKRISKGFKNSRLVEDKFDIYSSVKNAPDSDFYESLYSYNEDHYKHYHDNDESVAGIVGVTTNKIIFDLDDSDDINRAKTDGIELCSRLIAKGIPQDKIQIFFSGSKGFHVELETTEEFTRPEYENILENFAGDLTTLDKKVTDEQRLFRVALTKHQKSSLYKIPLSLNSLTETPIELIRAEAENITPEHWEMMEGHKEVVLPEAMRALKDVTPIHKKTKEKIDLNFTEEYTSIDKPKWMCPVKYALQQGFFKEGNRNEAFMILASTYKNNGFPKEITWRILKGVAELQANRNNGKEYSADAIWNTVIKPVYSQTWRGGMYTVKDNALLQQTAEALSIHIEADIQNIIPIATVTGRFKQFAKGIDQNTIKTGIKEIDDNVLITSGMMVGLLGAPSSGKTSFANTFVETASNTGITVLYQSMDMYENLLYARLVQKYCGYSMKRILNMIKDGKTDKKLEDAFASVEESYKNVAFDFRSGASVEEIEQNIIDYEESSGRKIKLMVVDYLEKVRGPYSDPTANSGFVASRLSDIAKKHDLCLLLLLQPQKSAGDPSEPLLSMRKVKGASVIEQDCRVILTMWRPGFSPKDSKNDKFASVAVVKNNMGTLNQFDFRWNGADGSFTPIQSDDRKDLNEVLVKKAEDKKTEGGGFF